MAFGTTTRQVLIKVQNDFKPNVQIGQRVTPKTVLGYGQALIVLEEYPITHDTRILVQDGMFVLKGTKLLETKGLFDKIEAIADHDGLVQITDTMLQIVKTVDNYEYHSIVKGVVTALTPNHIQIEAKFLSIPLLTLNVDKSREGILKSVLKHDSLITNKDLTQTSKKVIIISSPLTLQLAFKAYREGAAIIIAPSIDIDVYQELVSNYPYIRFGILQGFGTHLLWTPLFNTFTQLNGSFCIIDHKHTNLLVTYSNLKIDKNYVYVFKDTEWGLEKNRLYKKSITPHELKRLGANQFEVFKLRKEPPV